VELQRKAARLRRKERSPRGLRSKAESALYGERKLKVNSSGRFKAMERQEEIRAIAYSYLAERRLSGGRYLDHWLNARSLQ